LQAFARVVRHKQHGDAVRVKQVSLKGKVRCFFILWFGQGV
jgi:hypothetical protein